MRRPRLVPALIPAAAGLVAAVLAGAGCRRAALPPRPDGAAVVTAEVPVATDTDVAFAAEAEPNDTIAAAQSLGPLAAGRPLGVNGVLKAPAGRPYDADVYRIDIAGGDAGLSAEAGSAATTPVLRLLLRPQAAIGPTVLEVLDGAGNKLVSTVGGRRDPGEVVAIPNLSVPPGPVDVRVRSASAAGPGGAYRLVARLAPAEPGAEVEPNGAADHAQLLQPGGEVVGYVGWHGDEDWYRVPTAGLADGSVLSVDLDGVPGVAPRVRVFRSKSPAAPEMLADQGGRAGERLAVRSLRLPPDGADLLVAVAGSGWNQDDRYRLRVRTELPAAGGELEPNNDPAHAQAVGDGTLQGYLPRGDVDVFRYTTPGPVELDVQLDPPERASATLAVVGADGKTLARADAKRRTARLAGVAVAGGAVLIRVAAGKGEANPDEPYRLTITSRVPLVPAGAAPPAAGEGVAP